MTPELRGGNTNGDASNFVLIGAFTVAVIAAAFLSVMWFAGLAKLSPHT